eukprot:CAMPEP_0182452404 /NCGR_PEP_ID=MMETSP1172-20130603/44230_1 /TAXON_ID=708627 /ORGANISM="Timspurckia oligopyrenoides, Strain CCMP3278" /LENGTH=238 /DNA_ID=CAMNT_0024650233 /DNA_START=1 /DNA_END=717 /DNA_ORIENTATION=+
MNGALIAQGAEGRVYCCDVGEFDVKWICKQRFHKKYRHPELDEKLTVRRMTSEVRIMLRARKLGIKTPIIYYVHKSSASIYMEYLLPDKWISLNAYLVQNESSFLESSETLEENPKLISIARSLSLLLATLHSGDVIHGDLTTSNIMVSPSGDGFITEQSQLCLIDFGLSSQSTSDEDKAVDLYVLERAIESTHALISEPLIASILKFYEGELSSKQRSILTRLNEVRLRGRKREMIG